MKIELETNRCGAGSQWWTYSVVLNGKLVESKPLIYRMYVKESTAIRHGQNFIDSVIFKYNYKKAKTKL